MLRRAWRVSRRPLVGGPLAKTSKVATASACRRAARPRPWQGHRAASGRPDDRGLDRLGRALLTVASPRDGYWEGLAASAAAVPQGSGGQDPEESERGRDWRERVLRLEDQPEWMRAELGTVPVSDELRRPHPGGPALRDDRQRLRMKGETRTRAPGSSTRSRRRAWPARMQRSARRPPTRYVRSRVT